LLGFPSIEELGLVINTRDRTVSIGNNNKTEVVLNYQGIKEEFVYTIEEVVLSE
jgi:hypothetical protein